MRFSGLGLCALLISIAAAYPTAKDDNNQGDDNNGNEDNKEGNKEISTLVDLGYTKYQGVGLAAGVNQYLGLRFAAPPLGNLRFRAPADPLRNETTQNAFQVCNFLPLIWGIAADMAITARAVVLFCGCHCGNDKSWTIRRLPLHRCLCAFARHGKVQASRLLLDSGRRLRC